MWTVMMAAMMLPSLVPTLWRYRQSIGRAGASSPALPTAFVAAGYLLVWTLLGGMIFPLGAAIVALTMRYPALARVVPTAVGLVVLAAGALQFTGWKAHHLASCRAGCRRGLRECGSELPPNAFGAYRYGLRLGFHCSQCCAGLTAILLVTGFTDIPAMVAVTAGITLERLAPSGARVARIIGVVVIGAGLVLTMRAVGLS
jgi:predicted metal-binding membrane protein